MAASLYCKASSPWLQASGFNIENNEEQYLVRVQNKTHVLYAPGDDEYEISLLQQVSDLSGWPVHRLALQKSGSFVSVRIISSIIGGKGGFGTLLKGQSKQAGARLTTDFGACRDLQGRRLRHVNDEIKLRRWREIQQRKANGEEVDEIKELATQSGIANWHLMVPNWAQDSLSNKATSKLQRNWQRQIRDYQSQQEQIKKQKEAKDQAFQQGVADYVQRTTDAANATDMADAIKQGLLQQKLKKQQEKATAKRKRTTDDQSPEEQPQSLCTLSGDAVVVEGENSNGSFQVQSKSDFCTVALMLDDPQDQEPKKPLYYEIKVISGGLAQIGWAAVRERFSPNNDTGDGVGDDACSYAYDGSRKMKFHNGTETPYGKESWKQGDVVGCTYNPSNGEVSFSCNGIDYGVAFVAKLASLMVPAMSCNKGEILEATVNEKDMKYMPKDCVSVESFVTSSLVDPSIVEDENEHDASSEHSEAEEEKKQKKAPPPKPIRSPPKKQAKAAPVEIKPLDLQNYKSVEELAELGLDRLKGALMAMGVKCGGSLEERADRLFSLKGLKREDYPMKVRSKNFVV